MSTAPQDPRAPRRVEMPASIRAKIEAGEISGAEQSYEGRETAEEMAERLAGQLASRTRMWQARVPLRFREARLSDLSDDQDPDRKIASWWDSDALNLVLLGNTGVGKTHAAYAIGNEAVAEHRAWAAAWTAAALNEALRPGGDETALDVASECDLLVLDDLGGERMTEWTVERLLLVLTARAGNAKRTIVTTNLAGEVMLDRYGDRIVDRIRDGARIERIQGTSRRRPAPW